MNEIPTPLTNAKARMREIRDLNSLSVVEEVPADFARTIERELTTAREKLEAIAKTLRVIATDDELPEAVEMFCERARKTYAELVKVEAHAIDVENEKAKLASELAKVKAENESLRRKWEFDEPGRPGHMYRKLCETISALTNSGASSRPSVCYVEDMASELSRLRAENAAMDAALQSADDAMKRLFWTSDEGIAIRDGSPEDNDAPSYFIEAWNKVRAALSTTPPVCVPVEAMQAPDMDADAEGMNHELFQLRDVVAKQSAEITQLRGMLEKTLEAAAKACDENAERLAEDMDHRNKDHAKWWKRVQEMRALIRLAAPFLAKGQQP